MSSGAGLSPRQKMINMMYLVLMAMLALNVSKQILNGFGRINDSLKTTTDLFSDKNSIIYSDLNNKSINNPKKYLVLYEQSQEIKKEADKLVEEIDAHKKVLIELAGSEKDDGTLDYEAMDKEVQDEYFYPGGQLDLGAGKKFVQDIDRFREFMVNQTTDEDVLTRINKAFNTESVVVDGLPMEWLKFRFEHYPLAAALAFLSQMQAEIRNAEADIINAMVAEGLGEQIQVNKVSALMIPQSTNVMQGADFKAEVVMAAYDSTLVPDVYLFKYDSKGNRIGTDEKKLDVKDGAGVVEIPASSVGSYFWGGVIRVKNEEGKFKEYPFQSEYSVSQPAVVVSATKMNVVFRGVENPISVSVPGVPAKDLIVEAPGIKNLGEGLFTLDVTSARGREVGIVVKTKLPSGTIKSFPPKIYRIRDIPAPMGTVAGESDTQMPLSTLKVATVGATIPNFDFDLKLVTTGFSVKIPGRPTYKVNGNKLDKKVRQALDRVRVGQTIQIRDINAKLAGNAKYKLAKVSTVLVTVNGR